MNKKSRKNNSLRRHKRRKRKRNNLSNSIKQYKEIKLSLKNIKNNYMFNKYSVDKRPIMNRYKNQEKCSSNIRRFNNKEKDQLNPRTDYKP